LPIHGSSRGPVGSRDPVGIESGTTVGKQPNSLKTAFVHGFVMFLGDFSCFQTGPDAQIGARLDPDWSKSGAKKCKIGARLRPGWVATGFRRKTHISPPKNEHLFLKKLAPCRAPPPSPPNPPVNNFCGRVYTMHA